MGIIKRLFLLLIIIIVLAVGLLIVYRNEILKIWYPKKYSEYVELYSKEYNVEEELIYAIIKAESNFDEKAESSSSAKGLMQLMYSTATQVSIQVDVELNDDEDLLDPKININLGTKYISYLLEKYESLGVALAAYNAGIGTVDGWIEKGVILADGSNIENIPYKETNNYVRKILRDYDIYKKIYS